MSVTCLGGVLNDTLAPPDHSHHGLGDFFAGGIAPHARGRAAYCEAMWNPSLEAVRSKLLFFATLPKTSTVERPVALTPVRLASRWRQRANIAQPEVVQRWFETFGGLPGSVLHDSLTLPEHLRLDAEGVSAS